MRPTADFGVDLEHKVRALRRTLVLNPRLSKIQRKVFADRQVHQKKKAFYVVYIPAQNKLR
jgi:hypothetical protein